MRELKIKWLFDESYCETPGCSGGYAQGAVVTLDGDEILRLEPVATCFGSEHDWGRYDVYRMIFERLGLMLVEED